MTTSTVRAWIRRRSQFDLWGCLLFSHGWTWVWWSVNILAGYDAFGQGLPFTVLGGIGPLALDISPSGNDLEYLEEPYAPVEINGHE